VHSHSTIREHVTSVNEQRAAIHGPTVLSSALGAAARLPGTDMDPMALRLVK